MRAVLSVVAGLVLLLAACGGDDGSQAAEEQPPASAAAPGADDTGATDGRPEDGTEEEVTDPVDVPTVVATVAPVADLVAQVAGDRLDVVSLVPPGADAHTYEPRPSDVGALQDAAAFIGIGYDLNTAAVSLAEANLPPGAPVVLLGEEALDEADLLEDDGHTHGDDDHGHTHADDAHSHGDEGEQPHADGHTHERNPHVWTSVRLAMQMVDHIAEVLGDLDPEGAEVYTGNAEAYGERLAELDDAIGTAVGTIPEDQRVLVVYHDAWGYFATDHGLELVAAVQPSDFAEPSAADVRAIIEQVQQEDVPAIFGSEVFPTGVAEAIAAETGAEYVGTLADDVLPGEPGDPEHSYEGLMAGNARLIVEALGGDAAALDAFPGG